MIAPLPLLRRVLPLFATVALACSAGVRPHTMYVNPDKPSGTISASPAIWALSDDDTTIYLFGSVHMMKPGVRWFDDEVKAAFDRSDELVLEITEEDPAKIAAIVGRLAPNPGAPTSTLLPPKLRDRYYAALKTYNLPAAAMEGVKPWLVALNLSVAPLQKLGYRDDIGVEKTLTVAAKAAGKPVSGLETTEEQLRFFDSLPQPVQVAYLSTTVEDLPQIENEFARLMTNWAKGRPDALAKQLNESIKATPEMAQALLYDRNARWAKWIEARMEKPGTVFIAVGAGHLSGKGSVIDLLQRDRLTVRRIGMKEFRPTPQPAMAH
jgi:uncharacterized protein YbaP (TraB family)